MNRKEESFMLAGKLIIHQYKSFIRNEKWRRNLPGKIVTGIMVIMVILAFLLLGIFIDQILKETGKDPVQAFNACLLWYFAGDLVLRCFLQPLPTLQIVPMLRLPVRRKRIIRFLLFTSFWNLFTIIPLLVLIPFSIKLVLPIHGVLAAFRYFSGVFLLVVLNNYLAVLIGFLAKRNLTWYVIPISIITGLYLLQELHFPVTLVAATAGNYLLAGNLFFILCLLVCIFLVLSITRRLLLASFYTDEMGTFYQWKFTSRITGLDAFTQAGVIKRNIWLEINLLIRNKRPRQTLGLTPFYLVYFIFVLTDHKTNAGYHLAVLSLFAGFLPALYGQFLFSWESSFFDGIITRKGDFGRYIKSKYYLMIIMTMIGFIPLYITLVLTSGADTVLLLSLGLFTAGTTCFLIMLMGTFNDGRIDLGKTSFFNYQGVKANQFVLTLLFILLPLGLFELFKFLFNETAGKLAVALPGLAGIVFHEWWIKKIIVPLFYRRKYKNLEGYRKLSI